MQRGLPREDSVITFRQTVPQNQHLRNSVAAQDQLSDWGNDNSLAAVHEIYPWPKNSPVPQPENHSITTHEIVSVHVDIAPREEQQTIACILPVSALGEKEQNEHVHYS